MRILITGASGFVGTALSGRLVAQGHEVIALGRRPGVPGGPSWDPGARRLDPAVFQGVDGVVHLAGESIAGSPWTAARRRRIRDSRVAGTTLLASTLAALPHPPRVLVSISAVGIYGDRGDEVLTEASPPGTGFLADVCREWEAATEPARAAGVRVVMPRLGIVLDRSGGILGQLLLPFRLGLGARLGNGRQWTSWVSLEDVLGILSMALTSEGLSGPVNAVAPTPATNAEFTRALGRALNRPAFLVAPALVLRLALGQLADQLLLASQRCAPDRLEAAGYRFAHATLDLALQAALDPPAPHIAT